MKQATRKVLSFLLAIIMVVGMLPAAALTAEAAATTQTIYFQNNWLWSDVRLYYWGSASNNPEWPGYAMEYYGNDGTYDIYKATIPTDVTGIVINGIKNDGSGNIDQSPNIEGGYYDGICYYMLWNNGNKVGSENVDVILPTDYYLVGNINGVDHGSWDDAANLGDYKFVNGKLTATFTKDSYVFVKTNNDNWYMTNNYDESATSATLYNTKADFEGANKLFVPAGVEANFTIQVNPSDDTITLGYTITTCSVSFAANGGSGSMTGATVNKYAQYELPASGFTAPEGKRFKAWKVGDSEYAADDAITVTADTTVTAVWEDVPAATYTVTATASPAEGGTVTGTGEYEEGKTATLTATANEGYTFIGWYDGETSVSTDVEYTFTATENRTLTAQFEVAPPAEGDTFIVDGIVYKILSGGETVTAVGLEEGNTITELVIPDTVTNAGKEYSVVSIEKQAFVNNTNLTSVAIGDNVTTIGNQAFYGCTALESLEIGSGVTTIGNYAFTNCGSLVSLELGSNITAIGSSAFYRCGSLTTVTYLGTSEPSSGSNVFGGTAVEVVDVPADYASDAFCGLPVRKPAYNVTVSETENGKVEADKATAAEDETVTLTVTPAEGFELDTLTVDGNDVTDEVSAEGKYVFEMPAGDVVVTASFAAETKRHTVTFNYNDNAAESIPVSVEDGQPVAKPADPTWTGHSFQGWYDENGQIYDFATPVTGDITLTAKWVLSTHRINVGTNVEDVTAKSDPQFVDWHKAATATISLYDEHTAKYEIVSIDKVSYWIDNEEIDITDRCNIDNEKLTVSIPENIIERDTHVNVTVKVKSFGVTFDYSDGVTETKREAVAYGETVGVPADPTWTGYSFQGWYDENGQRYDFTTPVTGDITLTAKWKAEIPAADFTATGYDCGTLTNVAAGMQYSLDQGDTWNDITSDTVELTGLEPLSAYYDGESRIWVKMPGNGTTTVDSEIQKINVYRESAPSNVTSSDYNMITGVTSSMEYRKAGAEQWTRVPEGAMSLSGLEAGVYEVRTAAVGKYLASDSVRVTVEDIPVYTITYETYGGTINGDYATEYTYGEGATLPTDVTRPMYHFRGWSDSDKAFNKVTEIPADASGAKTFYAWWETATYTVTFHANNGTDEEAQVVSGIVGTYNLPGCSFTAPEGNFFNGWATEDGKVIDSLYVDEDTDLYATWKPATYLIDWMVRGWDADGTDAGYVQTSVVYGEAITAPEMTWVKKGYLFSGWEDVPATMPADNIVIYGEFIKNFGTVTWTVDGEIFATTQATFGEAIPVPEDTPEKIGYAFTGWVDVPETMPNEDDLTIEAGFQANTYQVNWYANGGYFFNQTYLTRTTSDQIFDAVIATPPYNAYAKREGYTFTGWNTKADGTGEPLTAETRMTEASNTAVIYYAQWDANQYTITFDTDGGSEIEPITQAYGTAVTAPADPAKEGHTFAGWDKEIPATMPAENVTIIATWTVNSYKVTFAVNGEDYKEVEFAYGEKVVAPAYEIPAGHTFSGWTVPETMPAKDITLDATLTINQYTITWKDDQDNTLYTEDLHYGTMPAFDAEQSDKELSKACHILSWSPEIVEVTENATYTAVWTLDHSGETEVRDAREATCTEDGYTGDTYCLGCGEKLEDGEVITAPGHSHGTEWESDEKQHWHECGCGDKADIADHTGGEATCKEPAQCEICGEAYGETDPENHTGETEIRDAKEATDTEDGYTGDTYCLDCGALLQKGEVIPATKPSVPSTPVKPLWKTWLEKWHEKWHDGCDKVECDHEYTDEVVEPTCCQKGYTVHTCGKCGFKYCDTYTEALGHAWDEGEVTKEASCTENGEKTYTCEVCGETRTEVICATGHDYEDGTCTHCGEAEKPCKPIIWPFFWRWLWKAR